MQSKFVSAALAAILYAQGLLGFAAVAAVLMKERGHAAEIVTYAPTLSKAG